MINAGRAKHLIIITSGLILLVVFLLCSKFLLELIGNPWRADEIYQQALKDLEDENYSNAYFQFKKVSYLSDLKPYAIYHSAECAKNLNDYKSENKQYYQLFKLYPKNELALKAKYTYAIDKSEESPWLAKKYFEEIIKNYPKTDYALGAKYQLAALLNTKYNESTAASLVAKKEIENLLRDYLKGAPTGRWALKSAELWQSINPNLDIEDRNLIAETYFAYNNLDKAENILESADFNSIWDKKAKLAILKNETGKAKSLIETGLKQKNSKVSEENRRQIITRYLQTQKNKEKIIDDFFKVTSKPNDIFLKMLKCKYTSDNTSARTCYANILKYNELSNFTESELIELFLENITSNKYSNAKKIGINYLSNNPKGEDTALVLYWLGCIYKAAGNKNEAKDYFENVIINYPDSYYAFRSYLKLNDIKNSIITTTIEPKELIFPYYGQVEPNIIKLVEYKDYTVLGTIYEQDNFVQSWISYEKGESSRGMCLARDAMQELYPKPDKTDLRWRLVYPTFLYEEIQKYAQIAGNNPVLMLSLTREESYFNPNAHSYVGAVGLMQLMPETAKEINRIKNLGMETIEELKNSETNLKLGNYYYNFLLNNLGENNILAIASYNGGIGSISRWKEGLEYRDIDEFVEKIPYPETKNYVKKVFRTYWNYARIYM